MTETPPAPPAVCNNRDPKTGKVCNGDMRIFRNNPAYSYCPVCDR